MVEMAPRAIETNARSFIFGRYLERSWIDLHFIVKGHRLTRITRSIDSTNEQARASRQDEKSQESI
jgi:hypothetical protein